MKTFTDEILELCAAASEPDKWDEVIRRQTHGMLGYTSDKWVTTGEWAATGPNIIVRQAKFDAELVHRSPTLLRECARRLKSACENLRRIAKDKNASDVYLNGLADELDKPMEGK